MGWEWGRSGGGEKDFLPVLSFIISGEFSWGPQKISPHLQPLSPECLETRPRVFAEEDLAWGAGAGFPSSLGLRRVPVSEATSRSDAVSPALCCLPGRWSRPAPGVLEKPPAEGDTPAAAPTWKRPGPGGGR